MKLEMYVDEALLAKRCEVLLYRNEAENGLLLGLLENTAQFLFAGIVADQDRPVLAFMRTPVSMVVSRGSDEAFKFLADELMTRELAVDSSVGPMPDIQRWADAWSCASGLVNRIRFEQRIYWLHQVENMGTAIGELQRATTKDLDCLTDWTLDFKHELGLKPESVENCRREVESLIESERAFIWQSEGRRVSVASLTRPTRNGITVSGVYTPPDERGKGYATSLVACLSQRALDSGREFCCLYTDLANPTSNSIYRRIGYVPVCDSRQVIFELG